MKSSWRQWSSRLLECASLVVLVFWQCMSVAAAAPNVKSAPHVTATPPRASSQSAERSVYRGATVAESTSPVWPAQVRAPDGAPNVLIILTDDVGFGASSTFGGLISTPTLDSLAASGLRYNEFHNTAQCSPTRASLLTGRNHTRVGMGAVTDRATGYEGYTTLISKEAGTVAEVLRQAGYNTAAFGKWHLAPLWETGPNGPYDHWPSRMGFDHFYGFMPGETDQWAPTLYQDLAPIEPPANDPNFILDRALADDAIRWVRERKSTAPDKPFFIYFASGTAHAPHHAPAEWIARYRGKFDQGWDRVREEAFARQKAMGVIPASAVLTPRPAEIPAWAELNADQQRVYAREMETYAGALSFADDQIGRLIAAIKELGQLDDTLVIYMQGDNGASGEGGLTGAFNESSILNGLVEDVHRTVGNLDQFGSRMSHSNYPAGWGWAMNTPFPWLKVLASHLGGTRSGMVMSWPRRITDHGGLRSQFHHVVDIVPTLLEAAHVAPPTVLNGVPQMSLDGISMQYTWDDAKAPSRRTVQFFTIYDNLGIYSHGWFASTRPETFPWELMSTKPPLVEGRRWELYHLDDDFSQARDVAGEFPEKLAEMQRQYWLEAARNNALPIHRIEGVAGAPSWVAGRSRFTFFPGTTRLLSANAPPTINRSFRIRASTVLSPGSTDGMLATHGGRAAGYGFYVLQNHLVFLYNYAGMQRYEVRSAAPLASGAHELEVDFAYDGGGSGKGATVTLRQDGSPIGQGRIVQTLPRLYTLDGMFDVGEDTGSPVSEDYAIPFRSKALQRLEFEVGPAPNKCGGVAVCVDGKLN